MRRMILILSVFLFIAITVTILVWWLRYEPRPSIVIDGKDGGYYFYKGKNTPGANIKAVNERNIEKLAEMCDGERRCVGFNSNGMLKYRADRSNLEDISINGTPTGLEGVYINL